MLGQVQIPFIILWHSAESRFKCSILDTFWIQDIVINFIFSDILLNQDINAVFWHPVNLGWFCSIFRYPVNEYT